MSIQDPSDYKTGNSVPSNAAMDVNDNAKVFDVFSNSEIPSVQSRLGKPIKTLYQHGKDFTDTLDSLAMQYTIVNSGNWSTVAGQEITEQDRLKGYEYPDDSGNVYAVRGSVTLPITRPASPEGDDRFYLASAVNKSEFGNVAFLSKDSTTARSLAYRFADVVNVKDFGAVGDGVADDTIAIKAALLVGGAVFIPDGIYKVTDTLHMTVNGTRFFGESNRSIIEAENMSDRPVIMTFDGVSDVRTSNMHMDSITVAGDAHTAFAWVNTVVGGMTNCRVEDGSTGGKPFNGEHGFLFERSWGCVHTNLATNGATLVVPFVVYQVVLATVFNSLYTSNGSTVHSIYLNSDIRKYSVGTALGAGVLVFNQPTFQGCTSYAMVIKGFEKVSVRNAYDENVGAHYYIDSLNTRNIEISNSTVTSFADPTAGGTHSTWIGGHISAAGTMHDINFNNCIFGKGKFVLDGVYSRCNINTPFVFSNKLIEDSLEYGPNCPTTMPLTVADTTNDSGNTSYSLYPPTYSGYRNLRKVINGASSYTSSDVAIPMSNETPYTVYDGGL